jgi:glycosyltransferase involved in cell wall biosynthesis
MKTLLYDLHLCQSDDGYPGGSVVAFALLKGIFNSEFADKADIWLAFNFDRKIPGFISVYASQNKNCVFDVKTPNEFLNLANELEPDKVFLPYFVNKYNKITNKIQIISWIHDMRQIEINETILNDKNRLMFYKNPKFSHLIYFRFLIHFNLIKKAIIVFRKQLLLNRFHKFSRRIDLIITISDYSKNSIISNLKNKVHSIESKIEVSYPPIKLLEKGNSAYISKYNNYLLLIGGNRYEKNVHTLLPIIDELYTENGLSQNTIIIGFPPLKVVDRLINRSKFIILGLQSDSELRSLYTGCDLFIYPSINEGFGLPPIEAIQYGSKVLASNLSSIPEVCGDSVFYLDPLNINEIKSSILVALNSDIPSNNYARNTMLKMKSDSKKLVNKLLG